MRPLRPLITFVTAELTTTLLSAIHIDVSPTSRWDAASPIGPPEVTTTRCPFRVVGSRREQRGPDPVCEDGKDSR